MKEGRILAKVKDFEDIKYKDMFPCFVDAMKSSCGQIIEVKYRDHSSSNIYLGSDGYLYREEWLDFDFAPDQQTLDIMSEFVDIMDKSDIIDLIGR